MTHHARRLPPQQRPSRLTLANLTARLALMLAACTAAPAALADTVLDFDSFAPTMLGYNQRFKDQGYRLTAYLAGDGNRPDDLAGAIFDGNTNAGCLGLSCPTNNFTPGYYAGLNDGVLLIDSLSGNGVHIHSFDASFIGAHQDNDYPQTAGLIEVRGFLSDGSYLSRQFDLRGPLGNEFFMDHYVTDSVFANTAFTEVAFFAYSCDYSSQCVAFGSGQGQFALDNVTTAVTAAAPVPEASSWLLLLSGLSAVSFAARRRRA